MTKSPLRVALFGAGGFAADHVRIIEELQAERLVRFVAVADPAVEKLAALKGRLESVGVRWFENFRKLLDDLDGQMDAVVISTPIPLHLSMLEAALDHNLAVYLEKPPVPLIQDFLRLSARPEIQRVAVAFKLVADRNLWRLKRAILGGALGKIRSVNASACWPRLDSYYNRAGWAGKITWNGMAVLDGPATNALAHIIHNMMFLGGQSIAEFAVPQAIKAELYQARPMESYDICCLAGDWATGVRFAAAFTHAVERPVDWSILVEGECGTARLTNQNVVFETNAPIPPAEKNGPDGYRDCWLNFHGFATGRIPKPLSSFDDCLGYAKATNAMFLSAGKIHTLPRSAVRRYERDGDGGFDVPDLANSMGQLHKSGCLFSDQSVPWARPGACINAVDLNNIAINDFLPKEAFHAHQIRTRQV